MVTYRSKMTHGKNKKNFAIMPAEEFIAAITQHIPDKNFQLARYYGWYSNRMRGERRKQKQEILEMEKGLDNDIEVIDVSTYKPKRIPSPAWRECIKKIWEVDPLECPKCKGEMKIISFIIERKAIRRILVHLKLWDDPLRQRPPPMGKSEKSVQAKNRELHYAPCDDARSLLQSLTWPVIEESVFSRDE